MHYGAFGIELRGFIIQYSCVNSKGTIARGWRYWYNTPNWSGIQDASSALLSRLQKRVVPRERGSLSFSSSIDHRGFSNNRFVVAALNGFIIITRVIEPLRGQRRVSSRIGYNWPALNFNEKWGNWACLLTFFFLFSTQRAVLFRKYCSTSEGHIMGERRDRRYERSRVVVVVSGYNTSERAWRGSRFEQEAFQQYTRTRKSMSERKKFQLPYAEPARDQSLGI